MKAPRNCQAPHPRRETCSGQVDHQCVGTRPAAPHIQLAWPWLWVWCWPRLAGVCYLHWSFHEPMRLPVPGLHPKQFADQFLAADEWTPRTSWKSRKGGKGRKGSEQIDWKGAWCGSVFPSWFGDASKHLRHVGGLGTAARCTKSDAFPFQNIRKICDHLQVCKWFSYKLMDLLTMDEFGISYILYVFYIYIWWRSYILKLNLFRVGVPEDQKVCNCGVLWGHRTLRYDYAGELHATPCKSRFLVASCSSSGSSRFLSCTTGSSEAWRSSMKSEWLPESRDENLGLLMAFDSFRFSMKQNETTSQDLTRSKCFGAKGACQAQRPGPQRIGVGRAGGVHGLVRSKELPARQSFRPGLIVWLDEIWINSLNKRPPQQSQHTTSD